MYTNRQFWSEEDAPGQSGWYEGEVTRKKPGHGQLCAIKYTNGQEMWILKSEEQAFRGNIIAHKLPEWQGAVDKITPAFNYIESRLTDQCTAPYHMERQHEQMRLLQAFDPSFASENPIDVAFVADFQKVPPFVVHNLIPGLQEELPKYLAAAQGFTCDRSDVKAFTSKVLAWWAKNHSKFPTWATAARITFALSPNSAASERVFSLLKLFFGEQQDASLSDAIQASLMLAFNERRLG